MEKPVILSTKTCPSFLRELIVQIGLADMDDNAIRIVPVHCELPMPADYVIFSRQNATKAVLKKAHNMHDTQVLCVGKQSEKLLLEKIIKPLKTAHNMSVLIDFIYKLNKNNRFLPYLGNRRLPVLANNIKDWMCNFR